MPSSLHYDNRTCSRKTAISVFLAHNSVFYCIVLYRTSVLLRKNEATTAQKVGPFVLVPESVSRVLMCSVYM